MATEMLLTNGFVIKGDSPCIKNIANNGILFETRVCNLRFHDMNIPITGT